MHKTLLAVAVVAFPACGTVLDGKSYSHACATSSDCALTYIGDVCTECSCANDAIAVSDKARRDADADAMHRWCAPPSAVCGPCPPSTVECQQGSCVFNPTP